MLKKLFFLLFLVSCGQDKSSNSSTAAPAPTPAAKELKCGYTSERSCSTEEQLYIKTMNYFLDHMDNSKDLQKLAKWFSITASRPQGTTPSLTDAKVVFLGETHTQFGPILDTTTLLNAIVETHKKNKRKTLVLNEGHEARKTVNSKDVLLHRLYDVWENSRQEPIYDPAVWDALNATRVSLHYQTTSNIDYTRSSLASVDCKYWDAPGKSLIERNQTLIETVKYYQDLGEYDHIVVMAGDFHLPTGEYNNQAKYVKEGYPTFHHLFSSQFAFQFCSLTTKDIYDYMKNQDGLYITPNFIKNRNSGK